MEIGRPRHWATVIGPVAGRGWSPWQPAPVVAPPAGRLRLAAGGGAWWHRGRWSTWSRTPSGERSLPADGCARPGNKSEWERGGMSGAF